MQFSSIQSIFLIYNLPSFVISSPRFAEKRRPSKKAFAVCSSINEIKKELIFPHDFSVAYNTK